MRLPIVTIGLSLTTIFMFLFAGALPDHLVWHSGADRQYWQWVSAHVAHISHEHLIWNLAALLLLGSIIEQTSRVALGLALVFGTVSVNIYLASLFTLDAYAGLSGVLNSLLVVALYFSYQLADYKIASVITLILSVVKIAVEYFFQLSIFSTLPWPAVPAAHFAGLIGGAILVIILDIHKRSLLKLDFINFNNVDHDDTQCLAGKINTKRNSGKLEKVILY